MNIELFRNNNNNDEKFYSNKFIKNHNQMFFNMIEMNSKKTAYKLSLQGNDFSKKTIDQMSNL